MNGKDIMEKAEVGQKVRVHYSGMLEDGTKFDSSAGDEPIELIIGEGSSLPAFEKALIGMTTGDTKTISIPAKEAHGIYAQDLLRKVDRTQIPQAGELEIGTRVSATLTGGHKAYMKIVDISDDSVTVDLNHPLAGKDLVYEISMVELK